MASSQLTLVTSNSCLCLLSILDFLAFFEVAYMRGQMQKSLINRAINIIASIEAKLRNTPPRNIRLKMLLPQLLAPRCQAENLCCLLHS